MHTARHAGQNGKSFSSYRERPEEGRIKNDLSTVAAFFDFDGTVFRGRSGFVLVKETLKRRRLAFLDYLRLAERALAYLAGSRSQRATIETVAIALRDWPESNAEELGSRLADQYLSHRIYTEARQLLRMHRDLGHRLVFVSAATRYLVVPVAETLGVSDVICTRLQVTHGRLTGRVLHPTCWHRGKLVAVRTFSAQEGIDLARSFYYGDGLEDLPLFEAVGHPRPVNPERALRRLAAQRGWPVSRSPDS